MSLWNDITGTMKKMWTPSTWTDLIGLTDTKAPERGLEAMGTGADRASTQMYNMLAPVSDMYGQAAESRQMGDILDTYQNQMMGTENAASPENVSSFMNPMYGRAMQNAANQALAGAGGSLQSSAANNAVANSVANTSTGMWQQAFQNAMADAENKQGVYGSTMQSNLMPSLSWGQLMSDMAGTQYTKGMDLANAMGQTAGRDTSWFGQLF